jgi:ribose 5-phosphate isomerase RpiB
MRVAIGSDHAGFALKEEVKAFLTVERREVLELATHATRDRLSHATPWTASRAAG